MTYKILLVDDEPLTLEYLSNVIPSISSSWRVAGSAPDGEEALAFLEKNPVHLVISDIKMPVMNGLKLAQILKSQNPFQEIVILSGYDEFPLAQQAMKIGVSEYLLKPIKKAELSAVLDKVEKRLLNFHHQKEQHKMLEQLSNTYKNQLVNDYIKSVFQNSVEERDFYEKLLIRINPSILESTGCIMILKVDQTFLFTPHFSSKENTLLQSVLHHAADLAVQNFKDCFLLQYNENELVFCLLQNSEIPFSGLSDKIFKMISSSVRQKLPLSLYAGLGNCCVLSHNLLCSYHQARERLADWLLFGGNRIFSAPPGNSCQNIMKNLLEFAALTYSISKNPQDSVDPYSHARTLVQELPDSPEIVFRCAIFYCSELCYRDYEVFYNPCFSMLQLIRPLLSKSVSLLKAELIHQICRMITFNGIQNSNLTESTGELVQSAVSYIYEHFSEPITLSQIAEILKISPNYLSRQFHEQTGESYIKFLTRVRMEYAAQLLKQQPSEKISVIAAKSGYLNLKHFNYAFREFYHTTPSNFQKKDLP